MQYNAPVNLQVILDKKPEPPTVVINGYGDYPVKNHGSCKAILLTGNQAQQKVVFEVTDRRGYLILGHETAQQIGYIHFPRITLPKLTKAPKEHPHLRAMTGKMPKQEKSGIGQDLTYQICSYLMLQ